jgi:basic membrane lipoprotein Med (substrate-binding protein (PBP1-ABC) superfamily)
VEETVVRTVGDRLWQELAATDEIADADARLTALADLGKRAAALFETTANEANALAAVIADFNKTVAALVDGWLKTQGGVALKRTLGEARYRRRYERGAK